MLALIQHLRALCRPQPTTVYLRVQRRHAALLATHRAARAARASR